MNYRIITPPFEPDFRHRSKKELEEYRVWFHQVIDQRIDELQSAVSEVGSWNADYSEDSLSALGEWFVGQVETRPRSAKELQEIRAASAFPIQVPEYDLTNKTFSIAMDIGMY